MYDKIHYKQQKNLKKKKLGYKLVYNIKCTFIKNEIIYFMLNYTPCFVSIIKFLEF